MIADILLEYGPPDKVAAAYQPEKYLIGPHLFSSFVAVLQVLLPIVAVITLVNLSIRLGQNPLSLKIVSHTLLAGIVEFSGYALTAVGCVVVLFTIVQWLLPGFNNTKAEWNPSSLPPATQHDRVEIGIASIEILISVAAVIIFNFFPQGVNIGFFPSGQWWIAFLASEKGSAWSTTILSQAFFQYMPTLTILWIVTIALDMGILSRGRWENWSRWVAFSLRVSFLVLSGFMLAGPALVAVNPGTLVAVGFPDPVKGGLFINVANKIAIVTIILTILYNLSITMRLLIRLTGKNLSPALERIAHP
jgi:hypothetical protein